VGHRRDGESVLYDALRGYAIRDWAQARADLGDSLC
jgi:hypothetical protein